MLLDGTRVGLAHWPDGNTTAGGQGQPIAGVSCLTAVNYHIHTHLSVFLNGVQYALPTNMGIVGSCDYALHMHDSSGVIHVEADAPAVFTLQQFFAVWGTSFSRTNVGDLTDPNMVVYVNDSVGGPGTASQPGSPYIYTGDINQLRMEQYREITIQLGTTLQSLPAYNWSQY